jgi:hypothetical protein
MNAKFIKMEIFLKIQFFKKQNMCLSYSLIADMNYNITIHFCTNIYYSFYTIVLVSGAAVGNVLGGGGNGKADIDPMKSGVLNVGGINQFFCVFNHFLFTIFK